MKANVPAFQSSIMQSACVEPLARLFACSRPKLCFARSNEFLRTFLPLWRWWASCWLLIVSFCLHGYWHITLSKSFVTSQAGTGFPKVQALTPHCIGNRVLPFPLRAASAHPASAVRMMRLDAKSVAASTKRARAGVFAAIRGRYATQCRSFFSQGE